MFELIALAFLSLSSIHGFLSQPFLNIEDSSLNANIPIFEGYDSSMSVEMLPKIDDMLQILENATPRNVAEDDVEDAPSVDAYISKLHLKNLEKQHAAWKPYKRNLPTWAFFKVNKNQPINLFQNHTMWCIVCHNNVVGLEILALRTKLQKGLSAYHKSNGIIAMKNHVELEHNTLIKKFHQKQFDVATISLFCELPNMQVHVTPNAISSFFSFTNQFKKDNET